MLDRIDFTGWVGGGVGIITNIFVILVVIGIFMVPLFFAYRHHSNKKKYPFKIILHIRRNYGWVTNSKLRGGIVKDEKGVSMFRIPYSFKRAYETRDLPPSDIISADGTIQMARIGETIIFLNPKLHLKVKQNPKTGEEIIDMDTEGDNNYNTQLVPVTTQTKYSTLYEIKRASQLANAGKFDWKPVLAYGGLILLFIGVIVVTYIIYERIDIGAIRQLTETNAEIARTNLEIVDKLRTIKIGG